MSDNKKQTNTKQKKPVRKKKKARINPKFIAAVVVIIIIIIVAVIVMALGVFEKRADISTLTLNADGSVLYEEIDVLDDESYDASEIKEYAKAQIEEYNAKGDGQVSLKHYNTGEENKVYLSTKYDSLDTYSSFTGYEVFNGTIKEAKSAGYDMEALYVAPATEEGGEVRNVESAEATKDQEAMVLVIRENTTVKVNGNILFVSKEGTTIADSSTVTISPTTEDEDAAVLTYIIYK